MKRTMGAALAAAAGLLASAAQANLLSNGSFEAVDASAAPFYIRSFASTPGWTQFSDGVDLIHNSYTQGPAVLVDASDGVQFLDMNQAGALGGLFQEVAAVPGAQYVLTLDTAAWATNAIGGTLGYQLYDPASSAVLASGSFTDNVGAGWVTRTLSATALSAAIGVRIQGLVAVQAGMGLDNVVLQSPVPEPAGWALGLGGLAWLAGLQQARARLQRAGRGGAGPSLASSTT